MIKWLMIRRSYLGGRLTLKLAEKLMLRNNSVCDLRAAISACTTWPTGIPEPSRLPGHSSAQTAVSGLARAPDSPAHATANAFHFAVVHDGAQETGKPDERLFTLRSVQFQISPAAALSEIMRHTV